MKIKKWLYKIALPTVATAMIAPVVVSCSVEKKVETAEEKEIRTKNELKYQEASKLAPNLTKFLIKKAYYNMDGTLNKDYIYIKNIKHLKELTANINHLNDFEKYYLGLYEDIQNFFDNSIHRYTPENLSFEYFENEKDDSDTKQYDPFLKLEENTLTQEQIFYHTIYQTFKKYARFSLDEIHDYNGENKGSRKILDKELSPIINEKITEFSKKHKDFQFKNPKLTFRHTKGNVVIEVALDVEYQNQKLPEKLIFPFTFDINIKTDVHRGVELKKIIEKYQQFFTQNPNFIMNKVKTLAEMENILKSKDNEYNRNKLKYIKEEYDDALKVIEDDKEVEM